MNRYLSSVRLFFVCLSLVVIGGHWFSSAVCGQLTHYVPFDTGYTAGADLNGSGGSDLGFGANTWFDGSMPGLGSTVVAGNLSAPAGLPVAGDHARTALTDFNLAFYTFDQNNNGANGEPEDALQAGEHWVSFVARSNSDAFFGGLSFVKFFGPEILYIGKVGTEWGVDPGGNAMAAGGDVNQDTFLVAKLSVGPGANDDTVDLYINPALGTVPPLTSDLTADFNEDPNDNRAIDEIRLGSQNGAFSIDEIRIGASFADVAVPEPAGGVLLLGLAIIMGLTRRRRWS